MYNSPEEVFARLVRVLSGEGVKLTTPVVGLVSRVAYGIAYLSKIERGRVESSGAEYDIDYLKEIASSDSWHYQGFYTESLDHSLKSKIRQKGPWDDEQDIVKWTDPLTGRKCFVVRHPRLMHLSGYVERTGTEISSLFLEWDGMFSDSVHYGLTFYGEVDEIPVVGFDCAHAGDMAPSLSISPYGFYEPVEDYKTVDFVKKECTKLANLLEMMARKVN